MTSILLALAVVALVVYGLERNHQRQIRLGSPLSGSTDTDDRDLPRVQTELHASATHTPTTAAPTRTAVHTAPLLTFR